MSFVLVNADFSSCKPEDRVQVYKQLTDWDWIKMQKDAADINTVWLAALAPDISQDEAVDIAKDRFYSCCKPSCKPKAAFQWGYNEAGFINLLGMI